MLTLKDKLNFFGLVLLFGIALCPPVISIVTDLINHTEFQRWYLLRWLYVNGWEAEFASLQSFEAVYPWAIILNVLAAYWIYHSFWFPFSYEVYYCLGEKKLLSVLKVLAESLYYFLLVTAMPVMVLIGTQIIAEHTIKAYQCSSAETTADCIAWFIAISALSFTANYQRDRLDELDLLADQQRLRLPASNFH